MVEARRINLTTAKEAVFPALLEGEGSPEEIVAKRGLAQVSDRGAVQALVQDVLAAHPSQVAQFTAGNAKLRGFLVGQIMKAGKGKVDPQLVNDLLDELLGGGRPWMSPASRRRRGPSPRTPSARSTLAR